MYINCVSCGCTLYIVHGRNDNPKLRLHRNENDKCCDHFTKRNFTICLGEKASTENQSFIRTSYIV